MELADAPAVIPADTAAYRACYASCRDAGGDVPTCMESCGELMPGEVGGCTDLLGCFVEGFEIPENVRRLPGTIGGVVRDVVTPVNSTLLLLIGAGLVFLAIRR